MAKENRTPWYRRLVALAELAGDHTQQEIAETLGVSAAAVTGWKQGTPPRAETVVAAARAYDADATELLQIAFLDDDDLNHPKDKGGRKSRRIELSPRADLPPY